MLNDSYYGIKKIAGKRKEHSLQITDRKIAERKLAEWVKNLDKLDSTAEKTTLRQLLAKFVASRQGKSDLTKATDDFIAKRFEAEWKQVLDIHISLIKPSHLDEWLAANESRIENMTYNRYCDFLKALFDVLIPLAPVLSFSRNRLGLCEQPSPVAFGMLPSGSCGG